MTLQYCSHPHAVHSIKEQHHTTVICYVSIRVISREGCHYSCSHQNIDLALTLFLSCYLQDVRPSLTGFTHPQDCRCVRWFIALQCNDGIFTSKFKPIENYLEKYMHCIVLYFSISTGCLQQTSICKLVCYRLCFSRCLLFVDDLLQCSKCILSYGDNSTLLSHSYR